MAEVRVGASQIVEAPAGEPRHRAGEGTPSVGGWVWRYDLTPAGPSSTEVTLSYDWSAVPESLRLAQDSPVREFDPDPSRPGRSGATWAVDRGWRCVHDPGCGPCRRHPVARTNPVRSLDQIS